MLSVLAGLKVPDAGTLIRRVLLGGLLESDNALWSEIDRFVSPEAFWEVVQEHTDFPKQNPSLNKLFVQLLVTHFAKSLHGAIPLQLANQVITPGQRAYAFIAQWMRDQQDSPGWKSLSSEVAEQLHIFDAIENLDPEVLFEAASFEVVDQVLIRTCVKMLRAQIRQQTAELASWQTWLQARHTVIWFPKYEKIYQALEAAIALLEFKQQYTEGFRQSAPVLFKAYASDLHRFDRAYRHFIVESDDAQGDILKGLIEDVENLYTQWFLDGLGDAWSNALGERWELQGIASQTRFFGRYVLPILERSDREKAFVIISDALRYEVASELQEVIQKEIRGETSLEAQFGVLPSITRLGMAALLPLSSKLELIPGSDDVLLNGLSTKGMLARQKVLTQNSRIEATVLDAKDLLAMSTEDGRSVVQPYRLIYIYHNVIDAIGDKAPSERQVLSACGQAVSELLRLVKKICNSINGTNVIITADHGFLYQRRPIQEADKRPLPSSEAVLESKRRYLLAREWVSDSTLLHFSLPYAENSVVAIVPRGSLRFAVQGAGAQFVHGGASLQEVCVPVISYHHQRAKGDEGPARKVGVQVSARVRRVTNNRFSLTLVQTDAVEGRWRSRQVTVALYDPQTNTPITDVRGAILSSTSPHPSGREISLRLTVTTTNPPTNAYLIVKDADDESELLRENWAVSLGIANDFGDF